MAPYLTSVFSLFSSSTTVLSAPVAASHCLSSEVDRVVHTLDPKFCQHLSFLSDTFTGNSGCQFPALNLSCSVATYSCTLRPQTPLTCKGNMTQGSRSVESFPSFGPNSSIASSEMCFSSVSSFLL